MGYLWVAACSLGSQSPSRSLRPAPNAFQRGWKSSNYIKAQQVRVRLPSLGSPVLRLLLLVNLARSIHSCEVKWRRAPWQRCNLFVWNIPSLSSPRQRPPGNLLLISTSVSWPPTPKCNLQPGWGKWELPFLLFLNLPLIDIKSGNFYCASIKTQISFTSMVEQQTVSDGQHDGQYDASILKKINKTQH